MLNRAILAQLASLPGAGVSPFFDDNSELAGRAIADPIASIQRVSVPLTGLVLRRTSPQALDIAASSFFPIVPTDKIVFSIPDVSNEEMVVPVDYAERGASADMAYDRFSVGETPDKLTRHSFYYLVDRDTMRNQVQPWDVSEMASWKARRRVLLAIDAKAAIKIATTTGTTVYGNVLPGGNWTGNGEMLADINAAAEILAATVGVGKEMLKVHFFSETVAKAEADALFMERRAFTQGAVNPTLEDVARYLGVASVQKTTAIYKPSKEATPDYLFPDLAIVYYSGDETLLAGFPGDDVWARTFRLRNDAAPETPNGGAGYDPFYLPTSTSWGFPWELYNQHRILNSLAAVAVTAPT